MRKWRKFFENDLWNFRLNEKTGWTRLFYRWLRVLALSARKFTQDRCTLYASSLTYYTLMSLVPILAMSFAVARGFGYQEHLQRELFARFEDQAVILTELFSFTQNMLAQVRGGIIAMVGLLVLFWSVFQLLGNMEGALNRIWGVKKLRSWRRIGSDYFALMLIGPFLFVLSSSFTVFLADLMRKAIPLLPMQAWLSALLIFFIRLIPYGLFGLLFTFVYYFMPNTKVRAAPAWVGGMVAGALYILIQWAYIHFQVGVSRYGAVYGSFAALPLFLIWLQLSWFLLLFGAEICHAFQTVEVYEFEQAIGKRSHSFNLLLSLWIVHLCIKRFVSSNGWLTRELLVHRYRLPYLLANPIVDDLIAARVLIETKEGIVPALPAESVRIADVIYALESQGTAQFPFIDANALALFEQTLEAFRQQIESSPSNQALIHVPTPS